MIYGVVGHIGYGKSLAATKAGIEMANLKQKQLVTNYKLNIPALYKYAKLKKLKWILNLIDKGAISYIEKPNKIESLMIPNSIVIFDEVGIFVNSRDFQTNSKQLLQDLCQSRKDGIDLIWMSQFDEQVDRQFRLLTHAFVYCNGVSTYSIKQKKNILIYKRNYWMRSGDYFQWQTDKSSRNNHFKIRAAYAMKYEGGFLDTGDKLLFEVYDSFARLDKKESAAVCTLERCEISERLKESIYFDSVVPGAGIEVIGSRGERFQPGVTDLVKVALGVARRAGAKAPYFKGMAPEQIKEFIEKNSFEYGF